MNVKQQVFAIKPVYWLSHVRNDLQRQIGKSSKQKCFKIINLLLFLELFSKSVTFRFDKSAKHVKNNSPKTEKNIFSMLNLLQKYRKMFDCSTKYSLNFFKSESLKIA